MDPRFSRPTVRLRPSSARVLAAAVFALTLLSGLGAPGAESGSSADTRSFVPPPRSVSDITAILDAQKLDDPVEWQRNLRRAEREVPHDADPERLARFYYNRGRAAEHVGRTAQAIADLTAAYRLGEHLSVRRRLKLLRLLALTEGKAGSRAKGIAYWREAIALSESARRPLKYKAQYLGRLAQALASAGKIAEAKRHLATARKIVDGLGHSVAAYRRRGAESLSDGALGQFRETEGRLFISTGDYRKAEAAFRAAIDHHARDGNSNRVNTTRSGLAKALSAQGRHVEAEVESRRALLYLLRKVGRNNRRTGTRVRKLADIIEARGRVEDAEKLYRASLDISEKVGAEPRSRHMLAVRVRLGDNLARQIRWREALQQFESARLGAAGDKVLLERYIHANPEYALVLTRNGRPADGLTAARRSIDWFLEIYGNDHVETATARGIAAISLAALGRDREALPAYSKASAALLAHLTRGRADPRREVMDTRIKTVLHGYMRLLARSHGTASEGGLRREAAAEAFRVADALRGRKVQYSLNLSAVRAAAGTPALARLIRRHGDLSHRLAALQALSVDVLSRPYSRGGNQSSEKAAGLAGIRQGPTERREREYTVTEPEYPTQDSNKARWNTLTANEYAGVPDRTGSDELAQEIALVRRKKAQASSEIARRFPAYAALMAPRLPTVADVQRRLKPGQALIATYTEDRQTYVWAVPKHGKMAFAVVPIGRAKLTAMVNRLRRSIKPTGKTLDRVPKFDVGMAHDLYQALLAPVAAAWNSAKGLLVVAHGPLGQVPFSVLVTRKSAVKDGWADLPFAAYRRVPWLARSHSVTALPTVATLIKLRELPPGASARRPFAGFADPWFSPAQAEQARSRTKPEPVLSNFAPPSGVNAPLLLRSSPGLDQRPSATLADLQRLPDTAQEVRSIARALRADPARDLFIGRRANEHMVRTADLRRYKVLAFASHALLPGSLSGLAQPALALTAPEVAGVEGDGLLTMDEILDLKLNADWVVLSACNTAAASGAGAEAVSGLGMAFLHAGTRSLLVTHWPIESRSARSLVTDLFARQGADARLSRAEALRRAKLALIDGPGFTDASGRTVYAYAHPLFWAPFQLFGEGAESEPAGNGR